LNSKTIFLIEDNPSDIALTKRALGKARIVNQLVVAQDGQEALDYLFGAGHFAGRDPTDIPTLTLMDMKLPKVSALDVLRRIRSDARTRRMTVVILTTSNEEQDIAAGYDLGVNSYIRKPVDFQQFTHVVKQVALYWLLLNEPPPTTAKGASGHE
jgi:two-component system, response regulator